MQNMERGSPDKEDKEWVVTMHTAIDKVLSDTCVHISLYFTTKECM